MLPFGGFFLSILQTEPKNKLIKICTIKKCKLDASGLNCHDSEYYYNIFNKNKTFGNHKGEFVRSEYVNKLR
jgi:hypothetical protein